MCLAPLPCLGPIILGELPVASPKEAKERRESEREPKKTAKSAELAKFFKEVETDEELEPAHSSTSGYKPHFFNGRLAPDKPISG
ncbi:hypothetical protein BFJ63_vAg14127 [Fusarium oxysporum f. sp. narcissi]|uniref:Uncharacterized protein n=2 Tax=Fusarium oxysporum TaxID=5507 RepID=A0A420SVQ3_FUSOX|nr:hypothetical protein BFJ68_g4188 [Fusarium oxysporum]RKL33328.1 hypothetical protein BFJ70_g8699 [Fusarium oxysporum]RYC82988.1 hypothetical protein BFJ63_vAg14127 [Fusarium oxysporum f. sp. narcissi]